MEQVIEHLVRPVEKVTDASEFACCQEGLLVVSANVQSLRGQVSTKHKESERISVFKLPGNKKLDLVLHQFKAKEGALGRYAGSSSFQDQQKDGRRLRVLHFRRRQEGIIWVCHGF